MSNEVSAPLRAISVFSGAGGMDLGLECAGFNTLLCLELDENARETLRTNRPNWLVPDDGDVVTASRRFRPRDLGIERGDLDLLNGGPPCQPFSSAAQWAATGRMGMADVRADTVHGVLDLIDAFLPRAVLLENVQGFVVGKNAALPEIEERLRKINAQEGTSYRVEWRILNAAHYGVPQNRRRAIILILRDGEPLNWPVPEYLVDTITAWDAIGELVVDDAPRPTGKWTALLPSIPEGRNYQWLTNEGGGPELFGYRTKFWNFLLKLDRSKPSWTLPASPGPSTGPFHWDNRPLSSTEALRLQSFPLEWKLTGDHRQRVKLAGNATPPLLIELLGRALATHLGSSGFDAPPTLLIPRSRAEKSVIHQAPLPAAYVDMIGAKARHAGEGAGPAPRGQKGAAAVEPADP
ncbi:DNA cytosine methyltransferase [uncultured Microbacterium sp.]|uniref:DNA cytosine methyltransferase n=1 Tax=uncultured Microbacterium sp. TaxID=191216 RepID=UPI002630271C|nr:DNA cytosine methyltransferase [uncultured Microbacterium sp.]